MTTPQSGFPVRPAARPDEVGREAALPEASTGPGAMTDRLPRLLLRAEGLAVAAGSVALYFHGGHPWWLLLALVLVPDLSIAGYLVGPRLGAATYDAAHTHAVPVLIGTLGLVLDGEIAVQVGLIWLAHIGVDRAVGYGLKYPGDFKDTHLQRV